MTREELNSKTILAIVGYLQSVRYGGNPYMKYHELLKATRELIKLNVAESQFPYGLM